MGQKRRASEEYASDGGFVEDAPRPKKSKASDRSSALALEKQEDDEGNVFWAISHNRRVTLTGFKGITMVSFREYYEKDGKMLPGKKGISLPLDQFDAVVELFPQLEQELKLKGHTVPRPAAISSDDVKETSSGGETEKEEQDDNGKVISSKSSKHASKRNHEETSDEDEDD